MKNSRYIFLGFLLYLTQAITAQQSTVQLDASFGENGYALAVVNGGTPRALDWQIDGKMIWAGEMFNNQIFIGRLKADGSVDSTFGTDGFYTMAIGSFSRAIKGLKVHVNGSITCLLTYSKIGGAGLVVLKLTDTGSPDPAFGNSGMVETNFPGFVNLLGSNTLFNADGSMFVGGAVSNGGENRGVLAKLKLDGTPDAGFGTGGLLSLDSLNGFEGVTSLEVDQDGNVFAAGVKQIGPDGQIVVYKLNAQGSPINSFGGDGLVSYFLRNSNGYISIPRIPSLKPGEDGKLIVSGLIAYGNFIDIAYLRLLENGNPDTGFGEEGFVTDFAGFDIDGFNYPVILNDARVLNIGRYGAATSPLTVEVRRSNGEIDSSVFYVNQALQNTYYGEYAFNFSPTSVITLGSVVASPDKSQIYTGLNINDGVNLWCGFARLAVTETPQYLDKNPASENAQLFPNPAKNSIQINTTARITRPGLIQVFAADGRKCNITFSQSGSRQFVADLSTLKAGVYFIQYPGWTSALRLLVQE